MKPEGSLPFSQKPATSSSPASPHHSSLPLPFSFFKPLFNLILPSKVSSSKCFLSCRFPNQNTVRISFAYLACHMICPSYPLTFDRPYNIWPYDAVSSGILLPPSSLTLFSYTLCVWCSVNVRDQVSHPHKVTKTDITNRIATSANDNDNTLETSHPLPHRARKTAKASLNTESVTVTGVT